MSAERQDEDSSNLPGSCASGPPTSRPHQEEAGGPCPTIEVWRSRAVNGTARLQDDEMGIACNAGGQFRSSFNLSIQRKWRRRWKRSASRAPIGALYWIAVRDERQNGRRSKAQLARHLLVVWPTQLHRRHCRTRSRGADSTCHRNQLSQRDNGSFVRALKQSRQAEYDRLNR